MEAWGFFPNIQIDHHTNVLDFWQKKRQIYSKALTRSGQILQSEDADRLQKEEALLRGQGSSGQPDFGRDLCSNPNLAT